ncbi:hypothetical protein DFH06DRAFT_510109 [Mycena polygramma]|nr:hypothetical protein DFH06DRAFT_510109 [Mycena polygramma]
MPYTWLSQANYIFERLQVKSNLEDYAIVKEVHFILQTSCTTEAYPDGYLFLCPPNDLRTESYSCCWPECPAYWAQDPSGLNRLSVGEATQLGFPSIELETRVHLSFWDGSVYAGLRQFHQGKGFNPASQEVARYLDYPLYRLSGEMDTPFAHSEWMIPR